MNNNLDFETFSVIDIKKAGAHRYASDPSTEVLCFYYQTTLMKKPKQWLPGDPMPKCFEHPERYTWKAFNAEFEMVIWYHVLYKKMGWPAPPDETYWSDTAAVSRYYALPGSLDGCATALDSPYPKDELGHRIMLKLSRPRKPSAANPDLRWTPETKPEDFAKLYKYCKRDVEAERWIGDLLGELPPEEQAIWEMNVRLNRRGTPVDLDMAKTIINIKDLHLEACNEKITELSEGTITKTTQTARISKYLGVPTLARDYLEAALDDFDDPVCRQIAELRLQGARSSTAKFEAMLLASMTDDRIRGMFMYHSATTGRFSASLVQPHNLPRPKLSMDEIMKAISILKGKGSLRDKYMRLAKISDIMTVFASLIRSGLRAKIGYVFAVMDFSGIEARVLAWLANELTALSAFRKGEDQYVSMAAYVYGIPAEDVTKDQRALGKAIILGAGYSMSANTFKATCESWGIEISQALAEKAIKAYREKHPNIKSFWYGLNNTCIRALKTGQVEHCGLLSIRTVQKPFKALRIELPNGKYLFYPFAYLKRIPAPWDKTKEIESIFYKSMNATTYRFEWTSTYGGKLVENVTQATARELLCEKMLTAERSGLPLFIHVHDETGAEVKASSGKRALKLLQTIMSKAPSWCKTLPLDAEGWVGERYRK